MVRCWLTAAVAALALALALAGAGAEAAKETFHGFRVFRVHPTTQRQLDLLQGLQEPTFHFWTPPVLNRSVDIMVSPSLRIDFRDLAGSVDLETKVFIDDVQRLIDEENPKGRADSFNWEKYHDLEKVYEWLKSLGDTDTSKVSLINIGKTTEGRDIHGIKISSGSSTTNKIVFVESGIHAREWITVATTTYLINELLTSKDEKIRNIADNFEWHIVPSTNPDGYQYTHEFNRLWRKTRSIGTTCNGADGNRNWDYSWNNDLGSSPNECSETYRGKEAFSEPEMDHLRKYLTNLNEADDRFLVYFCMHSYSQVLMIPYGLKSATLADYNVLKKIGDNAIEKLKQLYGTEYECDSIYEAIKYEASGGSMDWVKDELKVKYTFEWELRDKGRYGFLLPANQIVPTAKETIESMVSILEQVQDREGLVPTKSKK